MWIDPIVQKVRNFREVHAAKFNYDIEAIVDDARKRQKKSKKRIVSFITKKQKAS